MSEENLKTSSNAQRKKSITEALTRLEAEAESLKTKKDKLSLEYEKFQDDVIGNSEGKRKDGELSILGDVKDSQVKINEYHDHLFSEEDGLKVKINNFFLEIENAQKNSTSTQEDIIKLKAEASDSTKEVNSTKDSAIAALKEVEKVKNKFDAFCQAIEEREKGIKSQNEKVESENSRLSHLISQSANLLAEMTDKSLHNAFKKEAEANKKEHTKYFYFSLGTLGAGIAAFVIPLIIQAVATNPLNVYEFWFARTFIAVPFVFAYWLCVSTASIKMKLAEEYQHKASIAEALSGYREMWDLEHQDDEYKELFNLISKDLVKNPANKIKISHNNIFEKIDGVAKSAVKEVKEIINNEKSN